MYRGYVIYDIYHSNWTSISTVGFYNNFIIDFFFYSRLLFYMHKGSKSTYSGLDLNPFASEAVYTRNFFFDRMSDRTCKHGFRFVIVLPEAVSTRHSWLWQTLDDVYTRRCFSESEGTRFGAPGQKALRSVNEFTLLWIFA